MKSPVLYHFSISLCCKSSLTWWRGSVGGVKEGGGGRGGRGGALHPVRQTTFYKFKFRLENIYFHISYPSS